MLLAEYFASVGSLPQHRTFRRGGRAMITDPSVHQEIKEEWQTIISLVNWSRDFQSGFGGLITTSPPNEFYNLPLILAYSTLDHVLAQLLDEGAFPCTEGKKKNCFSLGDKLNSAKYALPWLEFALIENGKDARNKVAHRNIIISREECLKYVNAIGLQLKSWGILS